VNIVDRNFLLAKRQHDVMDAVQTEDAVVSPVDKLQQVWQKAVGADAVVMRAAPAGSNDVYHIVFEIKTSTWAASKAKVLASFRELAVAAAHAPVEQVQQLVLPIDAEFRASKELLKIWQSSISAMTREAGLEGIAMPTEREAGKEFAKLLRALIGSVAQQSRYSGAPAALISKGGRFSVPFQIELCDRFMIIPDQSGEFLSLLHSELSRALQNGLEIKGAWGSVVNQGGDIAFRLTPPSFETVPGFVRAKEIR
jgi:hypothetical protein